MLQLVYVLCLEITLILLITTLLAALSALSALFSTILTYRISKNQKIIKKMEIHMKLNDRIREIQNNFGIDVNNDCWKPNSNDKRYIRMYWYNIFDQWLVCCNEEYGFQTLWDNYYSKGVMSAIKNQHFREDLEKMLQESLFFGYKDLFALEIKRIENLLV